MGTDRPFILWAEDDPMDQHLIAAVAEGSPARLQFAADGVHLLEALRGRRPDLVVLDLKMPRMGGLEALRRLRGDPSTAALPVVVFSSGSIPAELDAAERLGVEAIVQKPIQFDALGAAVRSILGRASSLAGLA